MHIYRWVKQMGQSGLKGTTKVKVIALPIHSNILGHNDTYSLMTSTIAELTKRCTQAQSLKRWDGIKVCSLARITLGGPGKLVPKKYLAISRKSFHFSFHYQLEKQFYNMEPVDTPLCVNKKMKLPGMSYASVRSSRQ